MSQKHFYIVGLEIDDDHPLNAENQRVNKATLAMWITDCLVKSDPLMRIAVEVTDKEIDTRMA